MHNLDQEETSSSHIFWYRFRQYMHPSWYTILGETGIAEDCSAVRWNLAYDKICETLKIQKTLPDSFSNLESKDSLNFAIDVSNYPKHFLNTASYCVASEPPQNSKSHSEINSSELAAFGQKIYSGLSLGERFPIFTSKQLDSEEKVQYFLYLYTYSTQTLYWQRLKLLFPANKAPQLDNCQISINEQSKRVVVRAWRMITSYIEQNILKKPGNELTNEF